MSKKLHPNEHLSPNIIKDVTSGSPGIVAGEIAAEEEGLINQSVLKSHSYGSIERGSNGELTANEETETEENDEYALPMGKLYTVVFSIFMGSYLAALDTTVVTTLLSIIASDLNAVGSISWIATSYLLSNAAFQPLFGKLSDIFGRKSLLLTSCALFTIGCVVCATDSLIWLIVGRFVTGCGGSGLTTVGTITMSDLIPLRDRGLYQGLANVFFGLGAASGGLVGGIIADTLGWKYVFILQVPISLLVGFLIYQFLVLPVGSPGLGAHGEDIKQKVKRVDFMGSFFLVSSLMCFMTLASLGGTKIPFSSLNFIGLALAGTVLLLMFIYVELRVSNEPILPLELFAERTVLSSSLTNWFYTMGVFAGLFYVPIYFTSVLGLSATQNGERTVANFFATSFGSVGAGYYMKKTGKYYKLTVVVGVISILGSVRILLMSTKPSLFMQFTAAFPCVYGYSNILTITLLSLIASVPLKYQACTTSIQYTFRSTGSTLGVSIGSALFQNLLKSNLNDRIHQLISDPLVADKIIHKALDSARYVNEAPKIVREAIVESYALGCKGSFAFSVATISLGFLSSLFIREHVLHSKMNRD
ncbi:uncharacterized protein PRCAT00000510001 [Priceomyces carsonii]|uniref:uncharacterized protein n=1 Tax=Priceomyces carsonii TaxID=28549 RepID=UPI002ED8BC1C|nr:unnamed protein product [Priceomyces carsonii]